MWLWVAVARFLGVLAGGAGAIVFVVGVVKGVTRNDTQTALDAFEQALRPGGANDPPPIYPADPLPIPEGVGLGGHPKEVRV